MKSDRWTAKQATLEAEAQLAAQMRLEAEKKANKLRSIAIAVAVAGVVATAVAGFVFSAVAAAIAAAVGLIGVLVSGYFWTAERSRVALADVARSNVQSQQKSWKKQKPRDMVD